MYVTTLELTVKPEAIDRFLERTKLYRQCTRSEPGTLRCELLLRVRKPGAFVLYEAFRDAASFERHRAERHTREYEESVRDLLVARRVIEQFTSALKDPPPLRPMRPALDTARLLHASQHSSEQRVLLRVNLSLESMEFAVATDGFMRGSPDPCLLLGAYCSDGTNARAIGRSLLRLDLRQKPPCVLDVREKMLNVPLMITEAPVTITLVLIGVEENGGSNLRALYQDLETPDQFRFWWYDAPMPDPIELRELCNAPKQLHTYADRVQVMRGGELVSKQLLDDTWVGAALARLTFERVDEEVISRFHLVSEDRSNDWVALLRASLKHER